MDDQLAKSGVILQAVPPWIRIEREECRIECGIISTVVSIAARTLGVDHAHLFRRQAGRTRDGATASEEMVPASRLDSETARSSSATA